MTSPLTTGYVWSDLRFLTICQRLHREDPGKGRINKPSPRQRVAKGKRGGGGRRGRWKRRDEAIVGKYEVMKKDKGVN